MGPVGEMVATLSLGVNYELEVRGPGEPASP